VSGLEGLQTDLVVLKSAGRPSPRFTATRRPK
jgi:hypothetical protein